MTHNYDIALPIATVLGINSFVESNDLIHAIFTATVGFLTVMVLSFLTNKLKTFINRKFNKKVTDEKFKMNGQHKKK